MEHPGFGKGRLLKKWLAAAIDSRRVKIAVATFIATAIGAYADFFSTELIIEMLTVAIALIGSETVNPANNVFTDGRFASAVAGSIGLFLLNRFGVTLDPSTLNLISGAITTLISSLILGGGVRPMMYGNERIRQHEALRK